MKPPDFFHRAMPEFECVRNGVSTKAFGQSDAESASGFMAAFQLDSATVRLHAPFGDR
jgi:hypothetical protein